MNLYLDILSFLPDKKLDQLRGDVLQDGVQEVEDGGPEVGHPEAGDHSGQDGDWLLFSGTFLSLLLPELIPECNNVGTPS